MNSNISADWSQKVLVFACSLRGWGCSDSKQEDVTKYCDWQWNRQCLLGLILSSTCLPISLLPETLEPFVLKVIKEVPTLIYQYLCKDDGKKGQPVIKNRCRFSHKMEPVQYQAHPSWDKVLGCFVSKSFSGFNRIVHFSVTEVVLEKIKIHWKKQVSEMSSI